MKEMASTEAEILRKRDVDNSLFQAGSLQKTNGFASAASTLISKSR